MLPLPGAGLAGESPVTRVARGGAGPTLHLDYGRGESLGDPLAQFMYFVPLISPQPVWVAASPGNSQRARVVSVRQRSTGNSFLVTCQFEFVGSGSQRQVFDHSANVRRHEQELKAGGELGQQLGAINVEGSGSGTIEVQGTMVNHVRTITEVRLRFDGQGRPSPVTIDLHAIRYRDGAYRTHKPMVARVSALVFRKTPGSAKMEISVASVKPKQARNGFWQNLKGGVRGVAANMLIKPVSVELAGNNAVLNFGLALASQAPAFTFPRATNLKTSPAAEFM